MALTTTQEVAVLVLDLVSENFATPRTALTRDTKLNDLGDSLDRVEFAMAVEDDADIEMPDDKLSEFVTIEDVVRFVCDAKNVTYEAYVPDTNEAKRSAVYQLLNAAAAQQQMCQDWRTSITSLATLLNMDTSYAERERIAKLAGFKSALDNTHSDNARAMEMNLFVHGCLIRSMMAAGYDADTQLPLIAPALVVDL